MERRFADADAAGRVRGDDDAQGGRIATCAVCTRARAFRDKSERKGCVCVCSVSGGRLREG